jgi:hypothetical protein
MSGAGTAWTMPGYVLARPEMVVTGNEITYAAKA